VTVTVTWDGQLPEALDAPAGEAFESLLEPEPEPEPGAELEAAPEPEPEPEPELGAELEAEPEPEPEPEPEAAPEAEAEADWSVRYLVRVEVDWTVVVGPPVPAASATADELEVA